MWRVFEADSANQLWGEVHQALVSDGHCDIRSSRAGPTREILHAALTLRNPRERWVTARQPALNIAFALAELVWILSGRNDAKFLTYFNRSLSRFAGGGTLLHGAYGDRLRHRFGLDQLDQAYQALRANPESRQIVLQIWDARADLPDSTGRPRDPDIPCNTQSILKVRDQRLEWLQIMRSNDVYLGVPHNLIQFTFLQEVMAGWLEIEPGHYHHISDSLHLYERDAAIISFNPPGTPAAGDRFSLPKAESDRVIARLALAVDKITDEQYSVETIAGLPGEVDLPTSYRDILCVLAAEGVRRRRQSETADEVMKACTSTVFRQMWANWQARIRLHKKPS
jgi:thymidylate synthase